MSNIDVEVIVKVGNKKIELTKDEMVDLRDTLIKLTGFQTTKITLPNPLIPNPYEPIPRLIGDFPLTEYPLISNSAFPPEHFPDIGGHVH